MASQLAYADTKAKPGEKEKTELFITLPRVEYLGRVNFYYKKELLERIKWKGNIDDEIIKAAFSSPFRP